MTHAVLRSFFVLLLLILPPIGRAASPFVWEEGERVVLLGNTWVERAQDSGHLEAALLLAARDARIQVRNFGWSGDTVRADSRGYFGGQKEGMERLSAQMAEWKPTIIFCGYGAVAARRGPLGRESFLRNYDSLLHVLRSQANPREIILISPLPAETLPPPLPDQSLYHRELLSYGDALQNFASTRGLRYLDLLQPLAAARQRRSAPLTENGIHYSSDGYREIARAVVEGLGFQPPSISPDHHSRLRHLVIEKNRLFFHRWRPANETYLRGFRQHEQGQNAQELDLFDSLIQAKELEIEVLKQLAHS
ncbi:MAG: GDSL-type esterase/lipase family protein [Verrucomicrobiota bacterium]